MDFNIVRITQHICTWLKNSLCVPKIKDGMFVGTQIKAVDKFEKLFRSKRRQVWDAFTQVLQRLLRNDTVENYNEMFEDVALISKYDTPFPFKIIGIKPTPFVGN